MLRRKDHVSYCNATFMSLLPKKHLKSEINLALRLSLRNLSCQGESPELVPWISFFLGGEENLKETRKAYSDLKLF